MPKTSLIQFDLEGKTYTQTITKDGTELYGNKCIRNETTWNIESNSSNGGQLFLIFSEGNTSMRIINATIADTIHGNAMNAVINITDNNQVASGTFSGGGVTNGIIRDLPIVYN